jgi:hypothetical protein
LFHDDKYALLPNQGSGLCVRKIPTCPLQGGAVGSYQRSWLQVWQLAAQEV